MNEAEQLRQQLAAQANELEAMRAAAEAKDNEIALLRAQLGQLNVARQAPASQQVELEDPPSYARNSSSSSNGGSSQKQRLPAVPESSKAALDFCVTIDIANQEDSSSGEEGGRIRRASGLADSDSASFGSQLSRSFSRSFSSISSALFPAPDEGSDVVDRKDENGSLVDPRRRRRRSNNAFVDSTVTEDVTVAIKARKQKKKKRKDKGMLHKLRKHKAKTCRSSDCAERRTKDSKYCLVHSNAHLHSNPNMRRQYLQGGK